MMIKKSVPKGMQPTLGKKMYSSTTYLCVLLLGALTIMGHLALGQETLASDEGCITCKSPRDARNASYTVRNALPLDDFNLHMVCSYVGECGKFAVAGPNDILPCNTIEVPASPDDSWDRIQEVLCEFEWTRTSQEQYLRALVLVWSRNHGAPSNTYYKVDKDGFWFSTKKDGPVTKIGTWSGASPLSSETPVMGSGGLGVFKTYGHSQCQRTSVARESGWLHSQAEDRALYNSGGHMVEDTW